MYSDDNVEIASCSDTSKDTKGRDSISALNYVLRLMFLPNHEDNTLIAEKNRETLHLVFPYKIERLTEAIRDYF